MVLTGAAPAMARLDYRVQPGDSLSAIAARHGVSQQAVIDANGLGNPDLIVSGALLVIPDGNGGTTSVTHEIQPGETLSQIAQQYGVTTHALAEANGISDPDLIRVGQQLAVSGSQGSVAQQTSTPSAAPQTAGGGVAVGRDEVRRLISEAARRHGWNPAVPLGLAMQESGWNNTVVSSAGAMGLMQVMPATGEWVGTYLLRRHVDLRDPADNVAAGMAYLDYLYGRFDGRVDWVLAAYYEGPRRVETNGGPSSGADRYVANILALAERYR